MCMCVCLNLGFYLYMCVTFTDGLTPLFLNAPWFESYMPTFFWLCCVSVCMFMSTCLEVLIMHVCACASEIGVYTEKTAKSFKNRTWVAVIRKCKYCSC